jgi:hypothetical protein
MYSMDDLEVYSSIALLAPPSYPSKYPVLANKSVCYYKPRILVFDQTSTKLAIVTRERTIHVFDEYGRRGLNRHSGVDGLKQNHYPFVAASFHPTQKDVLCIASTVGMYLFCYRDGATSQIKKSILAKRKKVGENTKESEQSIHEPEKANGVVSIPANGCRFVEFISENQLLSVEQPEADILKTLPPTLWVAKNEDRVFNFTKHVA